MLPITIAKNLLLRVPVALAQPLVMPLARAPLQGAYATAKMAFARLDYTVAFQVDRFRRMRMKAQRFAQIERDLEAKIASLDDLTAAAASTAEKTQLRSHRMQLSWILAQVRGEMNTAPIKPPSSRPDGSSGTSRPSPAPAAITSRLVSNRTKEIPID
jgi:hypothetical protein